MKSLKRIAAALIVLLLVVTMVPQESVYASEATTNEIKVYNYLVGKMGLNTAAACGLLANAQHESNFNVKETGDGNSSFGLFQWHKGRKANLKKYCKKNGLDYQTVEGQLSYLEYELKKSYKKIYNYITSVENTADGAYDAGYYWCYYYEIPSNKASKSVKRGNLAKKTYWKKYKGYKGKVIDLESEVSSSGNETASAKKVSFTRTLKVAKKSMRGSDVLYIQKSLKTLGYSISADGAYGKKTAAAVKSFQKKNKIKADGKVGKSTWKAIEKAVAKKQKQAAEQLKITEQPKAVTAKAGEKVTFSVKATGKGLSYQWYVKKAGESEWTLWKGHAAATASSNANDTWDAMQVKCTVKDSSGKTVDSKAVKVTLVTGEVVG